MRLLADTANINELETLWNMKLIDGVTTNPSIISREGQDSLKVLDAICRRIPEVEVFGQVVGETAEEMIEDAKRIAAVSPRIVVKIPADLNGVKAIAKLRDLEIKTCATAVLTAPEALLCAQAGASYTAPYTGQNDIIGFRGTETLSQISEVYKRLHMKTKILAASIEKPQEMVDYFLAGADCLTLPYSVFEKTFTMPEPLTRKYVDQFRSDWDKAGCFIKK